MELKTKKRLEKTLLSYMAVVLLMFAILTFRLVSIQLIDSDYYQLRAEDNRTRLSSVTAKRGNIVSADGVVLVTDHPTFRVEVNNQVLTAFSGAEIDRIVNELVGLLNDPEISGEAVKEKLNQNRYRLYEPVLIKKGLDLHTVSQIEARRNTLPGVTIRSIPERLYMQGDLAGHILGYTGEVTQDDIDGQPIMKDQMPKYSLGDYIGKVGLEKYYDDRLRGKKGYQEVTVDAYNRPISEKETISPTPGDSLVLTLDTALQKELEAAFDNVVANLQKSANSYKAGAGAAVLLEVKTGKVLAMVSRYPDKVTQQNRAIQGRYIPGSIFKMFTALAALEAGVLTDTEQIYNPGQYWEPPYIKTTAPIGYYNLYTAMAKSDNVYFQEIGRRATIDNIAKIGVEFGLDQGTGIDLAYESKGEGTMEGLPTREKIAAYNAWAVKSKEAYYDDVIATKKSEYTAALANTSDEQERKKITDRMNREILDWETQKQREMAWDAEWHAVDTFNIAIGQGRQNYTPIQFAVAVAAIANGGRVYQPYVVDQILDGEGNLVYQAEPILKHQVDVSQENLAKVRKAMAGVAAPGGLAASLFGDFPAHIKVAAKTGTSQPGQAGYHEGNKQFYDGTFVAFAPVDDPQVVFVGFMEYGQGGTISSGRVCRSIFKKYFDLP